MLNRNREINRVSALRFEVLEIWVDFLGCFSLFFARNLLATFELQYDSSGPGCLLTFVVWGRFTAQGKGCVCQGAVNSAAAASAPASDCQNQLY